MKEIVNASKNPSTPTMRVFLHDDLVEDYQKFGIMLLELRLEKLVCQTEIFTDPDWPKDVPWIPRLRTFLSLIEYEEFQFHHARIGNSWILFHLDRDVSITQLITPQIVVESLLKTFPSFSYAWSELDSPSWWILVGVSNRDELLTEVVHGIKQQQKTYQFQTEPRIALHLLSEHLRDAMIRGIEGIDDFCVSSCPKLVWTKEGKIEPTTRPFILTRGSNLMSVLCLDEVDMGETMSTHIREVYDIFGIDTTCAIIEYELLSVLSNSGASVQSRHIQLLAERMCRSGEIEPTTYSGICQSYSSVLRNASFENTMQSFLDGAAQGYLDPCNGVTECVMVNRRAQVGTGLVEVFQEPDPIPKPVPSMETFFANRSNAPLPISIPTHKQLSYYLQVQQKSSTRPKRKHNLLNVQKTGVSSPKRQRTTNEREVTNETRFVFSSDEHVLFRPWSPCRNSMVTSDHVHFSEQNQLFRPWSPSSF